MCMFTSSMLYVLVPFDKLETDLYLWACRLHHSLSTVSVSLSPFIHNILLLHFHSYKPAINKWHNYQCFLCDIISRCTIDEGMRRFHSLPFNIVIITITDIIVFLIFYYLSFIYQHIQRLHRHMQDICTFRRCSHGQSHTILHYLVCPSSTILVASKEYLPRDSVSQL